MRKNEQRRAERPPTRVPMPPMTTAISTSPETNQLDEIGRDEIDVLHLERAGECRNHAGRGEGRRAVEEHAPAERRHSRGILPDGVERAAERRAHDELEQQPEAMAAGDDDGEREDSGVVEIDADRGEVEAAGCRPCRRRR